MFTISLRPCDLRQSEQVEEILDEVRLTTTTSVGRLFEWIVKNPGPTPVATAAMVVLLVSPIVRQENESSLPGLATCYPLMFSCSGAFLYVVFWHSLFNCLLDAPALHGCLRPERLMTTKINVFRCAFVNLLLRYYPLMNSKRQSTPSRCHRHIPSHRCTSHRKRRSSSPPPTSV